MHAEKASFPLVMMCRLLDLPRSTYYAWTHRAETPTGARHRELTAEVRRVHAKHKQRYGCRRVARELNREGIPVAVGTVASIMRAEGLVTKRPRAWKKTTVQAEDAPVRRDRIKRIFDCRIPGIRMVGDITYLRTGEGWLYLATVIDLCSRKVVGWQLADHMRTSLIVDALDMAVDSGHVQNGHKRGVVFHSDRGSQYTSAEFSEHASTRGVTLSCGQTGVCWDNAVAESFFATLKNEMYHHEWFPTRRAARFAVAEYIEVYYNRQRLHSTLGYRTPAEAHHDALHADQEPRAA